MSRQLPAGLEAAPEVEWRAEVIRSLESILNIVNGSSDMGASEDESTRFLQIQNNLSDVQSVVEARSNLGITTSQGPTLSQLRCYLAAPVFIGAGLAVQPVPMVAAIDTEGSWSGTLWTAPFTGKVLATFSFVGTANGAGAGIASLRVAWGGVVFNENRAIDTQMTVYPTSVTWTDDLSCSASVVHDVTAGETYQLRFDNLSTVTLRVQGSQNYSSALNVVYLEK